MTSAGPQTLRRAFGRYMTGVTVVTTCSKDGTPVGFTANSFTSVSLDPPLLLVCPGKHLSSFDDFQSCTHFAVSVLAEGQEAVSNTFASSTADRFAETPHRLDMHNVPLIDGAVAHFSCTTHQVVPAGDHCILIGRIEFFTDTDKRGLGYANGRYFSLGLERSALDGGESRSICGALVQADGHILLEKTADGLRPPQIETDTRAGMRTSLEKALTAYGVTARLGAAYSVFDTPNAHFAYFLATATEIAKTSTLERIPVPDLAVQKYTSPPIANMMARYAVESHTRDFSFYLGDAHEGDVFALPDRS